LARSIAITGNNLACQYEELETRSEAQVERMLEAAKLALEYWKVAGGWMQEERAEYRLAMSLLKAGNPLQAKVHADRCEAICRQNGEDAFELFYANDLLMLVHYHLSQQNKLKLAEGDQQYCENSPLVYSYVVDKEKPREFVSGLWFLSCVRRLCRLWRWLISPWFVVHCQD
jgi:hypothetical protein